MATRVPRLNCVDEDSLLGWSFDVSNVVNNLIDNGTPGTDDHLVFADDPDSAAGTLAEKIENPSTYDAVAHQLVMQEVVDTGGVKTIQLFTDKGVGAGDNYTVKINTGGTPGFLDAKIHADTYEASDTYGASTHRIVLAAPVSDAMRFYVATDLIKNTSGDAAPGYLFAKMANHGTYNASDDVLVKSEDTGSTVRFFAPKAALDVYIADYLASVSTFGAVRFCKVTAGDVSMATESSGTITPGAVATVEELVRNAGTGKLEPTGVMLSGIVYPYSDPDYIASGRWKEGTLIPFNADPTKLALMPLPCRSYAV